MSLLRCLGLFLLMAITPIRVTLASVTTGPELGPLISGTSSYVGGTFVWTDYAYDDRGATDLALDPLMEPGGDIPYPEGLANTADLIQLQIDLTPDGVVTRAILETLVDPNLPVLGVAFDTDANPSTGATVLPGGSWIPATPLGVDVLVVVSQSGARFLHFDGGTWTEVLTSGALVDPETNVMEAVMPPAVAAPGAATWRAFGVLGIVDPTDGTSWLTGGPIHDLAFVGNERPMRWQSIRQAQVLGGALDSSEAAALVDFSRILAGATELAPREARENQVRLYHSSLRLPEGVVPGTSGLPGNVYLGPYQPYTIWMPLEPLPPRPPTVVYLHGASQNHLGDLYTQATYEGTSTQQGYLGSVRIFGGDPEDQSALLVNVLFAPPPTPEFRPFTPAVVGIAPLARMNSVGYSGIHEQDVLDVLADWNTHFDVDPDRIVLTGGSLGGIGSFRLGPLYPDRWSFAFPFLGRSDVNTTRQLLENLANVPFRQQNGTADPLIQQPAPTEDAMRLDELGYDHLYWLFETRHHSTPGLAIRCVFLDGISRVRKKDPARVVYSILPAMFNVNPDVGIDLRYEGAYWVSGMHVRAGAMKGTIDVTSLARSDRSPVATPIDAQRENVSAGRDVCGPNSAVVTGDTWSESGILLSPGAAQPISNGMSATLTALDSAAFDLARMSLSTRRCLTIDATGDGPATLELVGPWSGPVQVLRDGVADATLVPQGGRVALAGDFSGQHEFLLVPPEVGGPSADLDGDGLLGCDDNCPLQPNTGQEDDGGIGTTTPDGIGNACQCGDVTGDGTVIGQDGFFMTRHGLGYDDPMFAAPGNCDVTGNGVCNGQDGFFTTRAGLGFTDPLHVAPRGQNCPNARRALP